VLLQILISGITAGSIYSLVALGIVLLHRGTRVVHFGYGDQITLSAYVVVMGQVFWGLSFPAAVALTLVVSAAMGLAIERGIMRPLDQAPLLVKIIATLALGGALREGLRAGMGPNSWPMPFLLSPAPIVMGDVVLVPSNLAVVGVAAAAAIGLLLMLKFTKFGRAIVAVYENPLASSIVGISVKSVHGWLWALTSVVGAIAGVLVAPLITLAPDMGLIAIKGFAAAILGGFQSLAGAIVGGILLGIIETAAGVYISSAMKDVASYALLILVVLLLPQGIIGRAVARKV
jgi:branched-chain amino acid transport system permease protein